MSHFLKLHSYQCAPLKHHWCVINCDILGFFLMFYLIWMNEKITKKLEINECAAFAVLDVKVNFTVRGPGLIIWAEEQKSFKQSNLIIWHGVCIKRAWWLWMLRLIMLPIHKPPFVGKGTDKQDSKYESILFYSLHKITVIKLVLSIIES